MIKKKDALAVALGRRGGKRGGPARAKSLSAEERSAISSKAATARWAKRKDVVSVEPKQPRRS